MRQSERERETDKPKSSLGAAEQRELTNDAAALRGAALLASTALRCCPKSQKLKVQFCRYYFTFTTKAKLQQKHKKKIERKTNNEKWEKSEKLLNYFMQRACSRSHTR